MAAKTVFGALAMAMLAVAVFASEFEDPNVVHLTADNYETTVWTAA